MADVFEVLGADHQNVRQMLTALEDSPDNAAGAGDAVLAARKEVAQRLVIDSSRHEAAEEQLFWPAVRERLPGGDALADAALKQEGEAKEVLARLDRLDASDAEFDRVLAEFIPAARAHIEYEETLVWPGLREVLSAADAEELGARLETAIEQGPTRPHPHTPPDPAVLTAAGPVVALVDKLRDAVTGRGQPGC
jgi:hemerythrin-like domain-containing protein